MEQKNKQDKNTTNKKKKNKIMKRYALGFPFHVDIKIISNENSIDNLLNKIIEKENFLQKNKILFFGLNTCLNHIQRNDDKEKLVFIFYNKKMESFYDLFLFRAKYNQNIHIYFINENCQNKFIEKLKLKKLLSFVFIKNDINKEAFNELKTLFESYDLNNDKNKVISKNNIEETTIEYK